MGLLTLFIGIMGIIVIILPIIYWREDTYQIVTFGIIMGSIGLFLAYLCLIPKKFKIGTIGIEYWIGDKLKFKLLWKDIARIKSNTQTARTSKGSYSSSEILFWTKTNEKLSIIEDTGFNRPTLKAIFNKIVEYHMANPEIEIIDKEGWEE
jgi:hypothetical protein